MSRTQSSGPQPSPTVVPSLRADAARNHRRLLEAAQDAFAEDGLSASITSIISRAGVAKGTFFRHFQSKDALIEALIADRLAQLTDIAESVNRDHAPGWLALTDMVERISAAIAADKSAIRAIAHRDEHREMAKQAFKKLGREMTICLERAQAAGEVRADIVQTDVQVLLMSIAGATVELHADHPHLGRRYRQIVFDGLRTQHPSELPGPPLTPEELGIARKAHHAKHHDAHRQAAGVARGKKRL